MKSWIHLVTIVLLSAACGYMLGHSIGANSANMSWTKDMLDRGFAEIAFDDEGVAFWRWKNK